MKNILFMSEEEARSTLYCAGLAKEHNLIVVGNTSRNKTIQYHPFCKKFIPLEANLKVENSREVIGELLKIIENENIDILMPISINCMAIVDKYRNELAEAVCITPFSSQEDISILDNKNEFYKFCKNNRIPHPESIYINHPSEIDCESPGINFPLLIKPVLGAGGFDTLVFINNKRELNNFLQKDLDKIQGYFPALLQEFFDGDDIDLNVFAVNGNVLASSVMKTEFYDKNIKLSFTSFVKDQEVTELGTKIIAKSGFSGPANIDMRRRHSDGKLMLIEVNPRFWARVPASLIDGQNYLEIAIQHSLNLPINAPSLCSNKVWISSFSLLLKTILKGNIRYLKYIPKISFTQLSFNRFKKNFMKIATSKLNNN